MKNIFLLISLGILCLIFFNSCEEENLDGDLLTTSVSSINVPAAGGEFTVSLETSMAWTANSSESWCLVTPAEGSGNGNITISIAENTDTQRSTGIIISVNGVEKTIELKQSAAEIEPNGTITMTTNSDKITMWISTQSATIDWGDGNSDTYSGNEQQCTHTYSTTGSYKIIIEGTNITSLYAANAKLTEIDVSENPALQALHCAGNEFTDLDVSRNETLDTLDCNFGKLTNLNLKYNTALQYLDCGYNDITDLDLTRNTRLDYVYLRHNNLSTLDLSQNLQLAELDVSDNPNLTSIDLSKNTQLTHLGVYLSNMPAIDLTHNTSLKYLTCSTGKFSSLDLSQNTQLLQLMCDENELMTELDLSNNPNLIRVWCRSCNLSNITLSNTNEQLAEFVCGFNPLSAEVINDMFDVLPNVVGKEYVEILDNKGRGPLIMSPYNLGISNTTGVSTADRTIATNKGWTVVE